MRTQPLSRAVSVQLDGTGYGIASTGPNITSEVWSPSNAAVSVSSNANEATAKIYAGSVMAANTFVDGTTWGSTGDNTSNFSVSVYPGQQIFAEWTSGDPGATATLVITGTRQVP